MARSRATIHTEIWNPDSAFRLRSARAQRLYFVILTQGDLSLCGVCALTIERWSHLSCDTSVIAIRKALNELIEHEYILVDEKTQEVWVRTFTKHDGVLRQPNVIVSMSRDFDAIQSVQIRDAFIDGLPHTLLDGSEDGSVHGLPDGYRDRLGGPFLTSFQARVLRTRARAPSPSPSPSPMVTPLPPPVLPKPAKTNKTTIPEDFAVTPQLKEWVVKNNFTSVDIETETQKFMDRNAANGTKYVDWDRAWQNWIRTGVDKGWARLKQSSPYVAKGASPLPPEDDYGEAVVLES